MSRLFGTLDHLDQIFIECQNIIFGNFWAKIGNYVHSGKSQVMYCRRNQGYYDLKKLVLLKTHKTIQHT